MQPLFQVRRGAKIALGMPETMLKRPHQAMKVARCISEFSNLETMLPVTLAFMLSADAETTFSMWSSLENRSAQLRLIDAAAESQLEDDYHDCWIVLSTKYIRAVMKERDKLAHWVWGYTDELPDTLLLTEPIQKARAQWKMTSVVPVVPTPVSREGVFVVTDGDLDRIFKRIDDASVLLEMFMKTIWPSCPAALRAQYHHELCIEPRFDLLLQDHKAQKNGRPERSPLRQLMHGG